MMDYFLVLLILTFTEIISCDSDQGPHCGKITSHENDKTNNHRFCLSSKPSECKSRVLRNGILHEIDETVDHSRIFVGPLIHSDYDGKLLIHENATISVNKYGKIGSIDLSGGPIQDVDDHEIKYLKRGQFIIPGFIDGHVHAVQYPNLGLGYDRTLLKWLDTYTAPLEMRFHDDGFASKVFDLAVRRSLKMGTTTASYYGSVYGNTTTILAEKAKLYGQRAFVGKVNRNYPERHGWSQSTGLDVKDTEEFIKSIENLKSPLVKVSLTPVNAVFCNIEMLRAMSQLAEKHNLHIQTHTSETLDEIKIMRTWFKDYQTYTEAYDATGLLTNKTILAHGVYLNDKELQVIKERGTAVIHCPASNTRLKSGLCDVRRMINAGVKVGLGTDVSGGNHASILDIIRSAIEVSIHLSLIKNTDKDYVPLDYKEAFYLATLGGAKALSIDDIIGNFEPGKEFDALMIDLNSSDSLLDDFQDYSLDEMLQRFLNSGDDRNIIEVYVSGKCVAKRQYDNFV